MVEKKTVNQEAKKNKQWILCIQTTAPEQQLDVNKAQGKRVEGCIWMWAHSTFVSRWQGEVALRLLSKATLAFSLRCCLLLVSICVGRGAC